MLATTFWRVVLDARLGRVPEPMGIENAEGLVAVADGVGGVALCSTSLRRVMAGAGLPYAVHVARWGHGFWRWHADLTDRDNLERQAGSLAQAVEAFRVARPGRPVFLVGKSGGTGVVARALEELPEASVERAILLAPALSSHYNLTRAVTAVRREIVAFWSPLDAIVLGAGTSVFGTIDGRRGPAAGWTGFREPEGLGPEGRAAYQRVVQVRWSPTMARGGYLGGHVGIDMPGFLRERVVGLLRAGDVGVSPAGSPPTM